MIQPTFSIDQMFQFDRSVLKKSGSKYTHKWRNDNKTAEYREKTLSIFQRTIVQLLKGVNKQKITRVSSESDRAAAENTGHRRGGNPPDFLLLPGLSELVVLTNIPFPD